MPAQTIDDLLQMARARLDRLDPASALAETEAGAVIVDTRCAEARLKSGTIPGSVHVPLSVLYWRLDPTSGSSDKSLADRDRRIILVCADGYSSSLAAATLRDLGFGQATDIVGGFNGWAAAGLPIEPPSVVGREENRQSLAGTELGQVLPDPAGGRG
jgi:rhodanese-related sulfurtransferase